MTSSILAPVPVSPATGAAQPAGSGGEVARPAASSDPQATTAVPAPQKTETNSNDQQSSPGDTPFSSNTRLDIEVQKDGGLLVKVRDAHTDKVVREIPPEELVEFGKRLQKYLGVLLDRRA